VFLLPKLQKHNAKQL